MNINLVGDYTTLASFGEDLYFVPFSAPFITSALEYYERLNNVIIKFNLY